MGNSRDITLWKKQYESDSITDKSRIPTIQYAMCLYLGYKVTVWEILRNPCTEAEEYCKSQVLKILAKKSLSRNQKIIGNQE